MQRRWVADLLLLSVAAIWGTTFTMVKTALSDMPPFWFLGIRFALAAGLLLPFFAGRIRNANAPALRAGVLIGVFLWLGYAFQTVGLMHTAASKAAFITGLNIVFVPLIVSALNKKNPAADTVIGVLVALLGLALLSLEGRLKPEFGDILVFICALAFAAHIVSIQMIGKRHDVAVLTIAQIATVAVISLAIAPFIEGGAPPITPPVLKALIVTGTLATSGAFLVQTSVQRFTSPGRAALILASEPAFAALFSWLWAGDVLTGRGATGAVLMFIAMIIAETRPVNTLLAGLKKSAAPSGAAHN